LNKAVLNIKEDKSFLAEISASEAANVIEKISSRIVWHFDKPTIQAPEMEAMDELKHRFKCLSRHNEKKIHHDSVKRACILLGHYYPLAVQHDENTLAIGYF
jgi:hypothetical protein